MLVVDSGLGGISVVRALRAASAPLPLAYLADTAGFPYGSRSIADIRARAIALIRAAETTMPLSTIVLACNTLSTLCLAELRAAFPYRFVGTVPAVKVAAATHARFTLLATPNTVDSTYSTGLIHEFAAQRVVDRHGAPNLAALAERAMLGDTIPEDAWRAEIAPAFFNDARGKTEAMVLGCTHYPLVLEQLKRVAPWPVQWIDSSEAIARQALTHATPETPRASIAYVTAASDAARYQPLFMREGFAHTHPLPTAAD